MREGRNGVFLDGSLERMKNAFNRPARVVQDVPVRKPEHGQPRVSEIPVSDLVSLLSSVGIMLTAVDLDHQPCLMSIEVHNVLADDFLAREWYAH
jgi:hypothetical protein